MKICPTCKKQKPLSEYHKDLRNKDGCVNKCKSCISKKDKRLRITIDGIVRRIYSMQKYKSKKRGHPQPTYTKAELKHWMLSQDNFIQLYKDWGNKYYFDKNHSLSCDRLDNSKGYLLDNMQLTTWQDNDKRGREDKKISIKQMDLENNFIEQFDSMTDASKCTGIDVSYLSMCCSGKCKTAKGYKWAYVDSNR